MKLGCVILNYESSSVLKLALESIRNQTLKSNLTIVVDNGSSDGYSEIMKDFPEVKQINLGANYGTFAANAGIMDAYDAGCDYIFLDDSDGVLDANVLEELAGFMERNPSIGIAGPMFYEVGFAPIIQINKKTASLLTTSNAEYARYTDCIGIAMIRREVIKRVGGISPEYFAYYNDTDFCSRVWKKGFLIYIVTFAKVHHLGGYTTKRIDGLRGFTGIRNRALFLRKNYPLSPAFLFAIPFLLGKMLGDWFLKGEFREIQASFLGAVSALSFLMFDKEPRFLKRIAMSLMQNRVVLQ